MAAKFDEVVGKLGKSLGVFISGSYIFEGGFHSDDIPIPDEKYMARVLFGDGFTDDACYANHLFIVEQDHVSNVQCIFRHCTPLNEVDRVKVFHDFEAWLFVHKEEWDDSPERIEAQLGLSSPMFKNKSTLLD
jgi:hypothetical protein